jgi:hypothetical protein
LTATHLGGRPEKISPSPAKITPILEFKSLSPFPCNRDLFSAKKRSPWRILGKGEEMIRIFSISLVCFVGFGISTPSPRGPVPQENKPVEEGLPPKKEPIQEKRRTQFPQQNWDIINPYTGLLYVDSPDPYQPNLMEYFVQQEDPNGKVTSNTGSRETARR